MPKLHSSRAVVHVIEKHGFHFVSQRGSHAKYRKGASGSGKTITVIVQMGRREIPRGTFASILRQSQLSEEDFLG